MMGALAEVTKAVKLDHFESVLRSYFPESKHRFIPMNIAAVEAGRSAAR
jgi:2-oxoglutarate ferredoxin oxidoreductase subunit gamma